MSELVKETGLRSVGAIRVGSNPTPRIFLRGVGLGPLGIDAIIEDP